MKYKILIYRHLFVVDKYESDNISELLEWYRDNWLVVYENDGCYPKVYEDGRELSFDEKYDLGFYEVPWE